VGSGAKPHSRQTIWCILESKSAVLVEADFVDFHMAMGNINKKFGDYRTCSSGNVLADRQTQTDRPTDRRTDDTIISSSQYFPALLGSGGYTLGPGGTGPSKSWLGPPNTASPHIVAKPPNLAVLSTHFGQLILSKISKSDVIRCQILRLYNAQNSVSTGAPPQTPLELTALHQTS